MTDLEAGASPSKRYWGVIGLLLLLILGWMAHATRGQSLRSGVNLSAAEVTPMNLQFRPVGPARSVKLPDIWDQPEPPGASIYRYRLAWPENREALAVVLDERDEGWALLLPRVGTRFQVRLDDRVIHSAHWSTGGYVDTSVVPHQVVLPLDTDMSVSHVLEIDVEGMPLRNSGLGTVTLARVPEVQVRFHALYWWQVYLTWMVAACSALLAFLTGLVWWGGRERLFAWLALASLAWAVRLLLTPTVNPPLAFEFWFLLHKLSFTAYCCFMYLFLWDLFRLEQPRVRRLVWVLLAISPVWMWLVLISGNYDGYRVWTGLFALLALYSMGVMFYRARHGLNQAQRLMLVVSAVTLLTGVRDFLAVQVGIFGDADLRWMIPGSMLFLLTMSYILVLRQWRYVQQIEKLNADLVIKVRDKEQELTQAFEAIREAEKQKVLIGERARLTRDMHDGLGSQLVQTLNAVRSGVQLPMSQIEQMLTHALEELRMTLDSMEPMEGDLPTILGTLRRRLESVLETVGMTLEWHVEDVPPLLDAVGRPLEAKGVMQLFRCVQEVFANVVKHAQATRVDVQTSLSPEGVILSIADNGTGMMRESRAGGRGLDNIRVRAQSIGAQVTWASNGQGTQVKFVFRYKGQMPDGSDLGEKT